MQQNASTTPITGAKRLLRGWIAAFAATTFAAISHTWAAPVTIEPALLMLSVAFAAPITVFFAKYRFTPKITAVSVLAAQAVFHTIFMAAPHGSHSVLAQSHHCGPITATGTGHSGNGNIFEMVAAHMSPAMLTAHILAAVVTAGLLCYGEEALAALRALLGCLRPYSVLVWDNSAVVTTAAPVATGHSAPLSPVLTLLRNVRSHRGPPAMLYRFHTTLNPVKGRIAWQPLSISLAG
ncbi:hypothetical protein [Micrococcoides hystricis]|uniref:Integral membrane protein n=1 Tax=Micrococcoides hystricis TaxID=1572761 RepID=A0ABV6PCT3_9MICC